MINGYSRATRVIIPAARSVIARELRQRYGLTEQEIAARLGVAQAAVSKYLSGRYSREIKEVEGRVETQWIATKVGMLAQGRDEYANAAICTICKKENNFECRFSKADL